MENDLKEKIIAKQELYKEKFFDKKKFYKAKPLMNISEIKLFEMLQEIIPQKIGYVFPQVGLRTIIETPKISKTSQELYKYIDFVIFDNHFFPILTIELNGNNHCTDPFMIARDLSNEQILNECNIPQITLWTEDNINKEELKNKIEKYIQLI